MKPVTTTTFGCLHQNFDLKPLPKVAFFQEGPGLRKWQWTDEGMKVINVTNIIGDGSVNVTNTSRYISLEEYNDKYQHFTVDDGDIVLASSGNTYGKIGRVNKSHLPLMMNTSVVRFHPHDRNVLDADYLYAFLRSSLFLNQVESFVIGSAQPNFGPSHLKRMQIPVPGISTQRKIASILSAYDDLIENNTRRIAILEEMAQAIYREWFVNFRFPGHENVKLVDSPLGKIPEGWEVSSFGEVATFENGDRGKNYPKSSGFVDEGVPFINAGHLVEGRVDLQNVNRITQEVFDKLGRGKVKPNDLLYCLRGSLGRIARVGSLDCGAIASSLVIIRECGPTNVSYLYYTLSGDIGQKVTAELNNGVAQPNISVESLKRYPILFPPKPVLETFDLLIEPIWSLIHLNQSQTNNLRTTRDLLLPKLISGKLDVEDLDIDSGLTAEALEEATA